VCTTIAAKVPVDGSGKGAKGWFRVTGAYVGYDHPYHAPLDHALTLDFVDENEGPGARVAVELSLPSGRALAGALLSALAQADAVGGYRSGDDEPAA
jgi:hypothetical protein